MKAASVVFALLAFAVQSNAADFLEQKEQEPHDTSLVRKEDVKKLEATQKKKEAKKSKDIKTETSTQ